MRPIIFITERTRHLLRSRNCDCRSSDDLYPVLCKIKTDFLTSKSQSFKQKRLDKKQAFQPVPYLAYHFRRMICPPSKQRYFSIGIISCQLKNQPSKSRIQAFLIVIAKEKAPERTFRCFYSGGERGI